MSGNQTPSSYGFIGLGLIGGSIARTIRLKVPDARIKVFDPDAETLRLAQKEGVADETVTSIDETFTDTDIIFLCAPVQDNIENLKTLHPYLSGHTTLTDIGSVKGGFVKCVKDLQLGHCYVGSHPMAGSERIGFRNASVTLLENAYYCLTHTEDVELRRILQMQQLVTLLGAIPVSLTSEEHDYITAAISHMPHIISASLVNLVHDLDGDDGTMRQIAAGGFKDITRISSSSPDMWQQICLENRDDIVLLLDRYLERLQKARDLVANRSAEGLLSFFEDARSYRDTFSGEVSGPIAQSFLLYVDIADEAGEMVNVLSLISGIGINIKNIGITHNREAAYGALMLSFYDASALNRAADALREKGYQVSL